MAHSILDEKVIKQAFKEALAEALQEQRELFHDIFAEVLEDFALVEAIREGRETGLATQSEVDTLLEAGP